MAILGRARIPDPPPGPADAELAALRARVDQVLKLAADAFRTHRANRQLCDFALDVRNTLAPQPQPDVPVIPGPLDGGGRR